MRLENHFITLKTELFPVNKYIVNKLNLDTLCGRIINTRRYSRWYKSLLMASCPRAEEHSKYDQLCMYIFLLSLMIKHMAVKPIIFAP